MYRPPTEQKITLLCEKALARESKAVGVPTTTGKDAGVATRAISLGGLREEEAGSLFFHLALEVHKPAGHQREFVTYRDWPESHSIQAARPTAEPLRHYRTLSTHSNDNHPAS